MAMSSVVGLGEASDFIQHQGSSIDPVRQKGPHAHSVTLDRANRFAFVPADRGAMMQHPPRMVEVAAQAE